MKTLRSIFRSTISALCAAGLVVAQASASPAGQTDQNDVMIMAAADCYSIGQQVANQNGGTLAKASESTQGGQTVCVVVVLVPGKGGQRPRRVEFVVPAN